MVQPSRSFHNPSTLRVGFCRTATLSSKGRKRAYVATRFRQCQRQPTTRTQGVPGFSANRSSAVLAAADMGTAARASAAFAPEARGSAAGRRKARGFGSRVSAWRAVGVDRAPDAWRRTGRARVFGWGGSAVCADGPPWPT
jgi:hypothetical protein